MDIDSIYQAARHEVSEVQRRLEDLTTLFEATFALSSDEGCQLQAHAELHDSGEAIEFELSGADVIFSLGRIFDRQNQSYAWELVAFHEVDRVPEWVSTMRVGPTASEYASRVRGARLVATMGDYLERQKQMQRQVIQFVSAEQSVTRLPQVAASYGMQPV